jgi:hypothetical protein
MPTAAELRTAALSDARRTRPTVSLLDILLPDVPGEPYGGTTTPEQRAATASATGRKVPEPYSTGIPVRPVHLREILRRWAHEQPTPPQPDLHGAEVRVWFKRGEETAMYTVFSISGLAEVLASSPGWTSVRISAPLRRGSDNATRLRTAIQKLATLDASGRPATPGAPARTVPQAER